MFIIIIRAVCPGSLKCIKLIERLWGQEHCWKYCFLHFCWALFHCLPFCLLSATHRKKGSFPHSLWVILVSLTAICTTLPRTRIQRIWQVIRRTLETGKEKSGWSPTNFIVEFSVIKWRLFPLRISSFYSLHSRSARGAELPSTLESTTPRADIRL